MVRDTRQNRVGPVDLLQSNDESQFVLKGKGTERPEQVGALDHAFRESVGATYEKCTSLSRIAFDFPDFFGERAACEGFAALIKNQAKTSFAAIEQLVALAERVRRFDIGRVDRAKASQARQVFRDARAGVGEAGLTDCNDAPAQGRS